MKILKQITAVLTAAAVCAATPVPAFADYYKEPANIKGVLLSSESEVAKAAELGVSPGAVAQWERGYNLPGTDNLLALANLFGCSVDTVLGREPPTVSN